jgi:hypothetical protein
MKSKLILVLLVLVLLLLAVTPVLAAPGGMPAAHNMDGKTFGKTTAAAATSGPKAIPMHKGILPK